MDLGDETEETHMELISVIKNFVKYVRDSEEEQNELLKKGLETYKSQEGNPLHVYCKERIEKKVVILLKEADEAA